MTPAQITQERIRRGLCACCGLETEDFELIAEADIRMCREFCIDPPHRDHRDPATVEAILRDAVRRVA